MRLTTTIARQSLMRRPGRTIFAILGIAVGIAVVVTVFVLDHCTIVGLSEPDKPEWKAEVEVSPSVRVADPKKDLESIAGVAKVTAFFQSEVDFWPGEGKDPSVNSARIRLFAVESENAPEMKVYRLLRGDDLKFRDKRSELLIGEPIADALGLAPGDFVTLARPPRGARSICKEGVFVETEEADQKTMPKFVFKVAGVIAKEKLGQRAGGAVVILDYDRAEEMFHGAHKGERFVVQRDPAVDIERFKQSLGSAFSYELNERVVVGQAADERAFRNGVRIAGLMALVLGLFVIFHTLSIALVERMREIATLHALGATKQQITKIFFTEALWLSGSGAVLGTAIGIGQAFFLLSLGVTTVGLGKDLNVYEVPWMTVVPLVLLGAGIALLGSVYPLLRVRDTRATVVLRGEERSRIEPAARSFRRFTALLLLVLLPAIYFTVSPVIGEQRAVLMGTLFLGLGFLALLVGLPLLVPEMLARLTAAIARPFTLRWPLAGMLAAKSMQETPARIAVSAVGIAIVTAGFVALKGMTASLRGEVEDWADRSVVEKIFVRDVGDRPFAEIAEAMKKIPGVIGVERADARNYAPYLIIGLDPNEISTYGPCAIDASVLDAMRQETGMIVTGRLARDLGYTVGSTAYVKAADDKVKEFKIVAIAEDYGYFPWPDERIYAVVNENALKRHFCIDLSKTSRVAVRFADGTDMTSALQILKKTSLANFEGAENWKFESGKNVKGRRVADIDYDFRLFDIIILLTAVLAALGVLNGQLLAAMERIKDFGVLKALGTTNAQITGMAMLENILIGFVGGAVGVLLGTLMTPIMVRAVTEISNFSLPYRTAGALIPAAWAGAIVTAVVAGLYPIRKMQTMSAAAAIRTGG